MTRHRGFGFQDEGLGWGPGFRMFLGENRNPVKDKSLILSLRYLEDESLASQPSFTYMSLSCCKVDTRTSDAHAWDMISGTFGT